MSRTSAKPSRTVPYNSPGEQGLAALPRLAPIIIDGFADKFGVVKFTTKVLAFWKRFPAFADRIGLGGAEMDKRRSRPSHLVGNLRYCGGHMASPLRKKRGDGNLLVPHLRYWRGRKTACGGCAGAVIRDPVFQASGAGIDRVFGRVGLPGQERRDMPDGMVSARQ